MRTKEFIWKVNNNVYFQEFCKINNCTFEYFQERKLDVRVDRGWYGKDMRYEFLRNELLKRVPKFQQEFTFTFGWWGEVRATFYIGPNTYNRRENKIKSSVFFYFKDLSCTPKPLYEDYRSLELPLNLNLNAESLEVYARKVLSEYLFEDGVIGYLQRRWNDDKKSAVESLKLYIKRNKIKVSEYPGYCEETTLKKIKERYNVVSYISAQKTVEIVNRIGKQEQTKYIAAFDYSFADDFDGDIDELEDLFYENWKYNTIYV